jgi:pimeloyl-ACP methyl ester carboxylesterase
MVALSTAILGAAAAGLGFGGWRSALSQRRIEAACPPIGSFVEVSDCRLHYIERGSGPDVVLVHGASSNLRDFSVSILDRLAERHRVFAFDRPGYGYSTRPRVRGFGAREQAVRLHEGLTKLGVTRPLLVGHSWAGALVLAYALEFPREVRGVLTLSGASHPWRGGVALYRTLGSTPALGPLLASTLILPLGSLMVDSGIRGVLAPAVPPSDYRVRAGIDLLLRVGQFQSDASDVAELCQFLQAQQPRYREIAVPLSIVTGTHDSIVSPRIHSHALHAEVPHSQLEVIQGAGHAPHHCHPDRVVRAIEALVAASS